MWEGRDPDGNLIRLEWERWQHIAGKHADLETTPEELLAIVREPERRTSGRELGEVWCYGRGGPSRWIKVVVHYERARGRIVTAFPRRSFP